jgi:hypothetical protein
VTSLSCPVPQDKSFPDSLGEQFSAGFLGGTVSQLPRFKITVYWSAPATKFWGFFVIKHFSSNVLMYTNFLRGPGPPPPQLRPGVINAANARQVRGLLARQCHRQLPHTFLPQPFSPGTHLQPPPLPPSNHNDPLPGKQKQWRRPSCRHSWRGHPSTNNAATLNRRSHRRFYIQRCARIGQKVVCFDWKGLPKQTCSLCRVYQFHPFFSN